MHMTGSEGLFIPNAEASMSFRVCWKRVSVTLTAFFFLVHTSFPACNPHARVRDFATDLSVKVFNWFVDLKRYCSINNETTGGASWIPLACGYLVFVSGNVFCRLALA